ncbi:MAG TPA: hypothetical protein VNF47_08035 [Streptosporangiaceae bacterium]|nr:hypothetical protein [Streptosporangiaceae bacterium]
MSTASALEQAGAFAPNPPGPGSPAGHSPAGRHSPVGRRLALAAAFVFAGAGLFALYLLQARTVPGNSDGASNVLQAWSMLHGNVLLRGWSLSDVSFYTTELPQYLLVAAARGLTSDVVPIAAATTYTVLVLLSALLARGRRTGREGAAAALIAGGIMAAPSLGTGSLVLLGNPDHTGTQVLLLATWLILDRARPSWRVPVAVALVLGCAQVADPLARYEGVLPLLAVCAMRMYARRGPLRGQWYELSLAAATAGSAAAAAVVLEAVRHAGGFAAATVVMDFAQIGALSDHVWISVQSVLLLFGADFSGMVLGPGAVVALVHLAGVVLAGWAAAIAVRRFWHLDLVGQVLLVTLAVLLLAYLFGARSAYLYNVHEIAGVLPVGAVLAGRLLAGRVIRAGLVPALTGVLACYLAVLAVQAVHKPASSDQRAVASWLVAHHLKYGLAGYWYASSVTVDSGNRVQVRPVARTGPRTLALDPWESQASWYDGRLHDASFVIEPRWPGKCFTIGCLRRAPQALFGRPAAVYRVRDLLVLVWHKNLLDVRLSRIPPQVP